MSHLGQKDADRFLITNRVPEGGQGKNEERAECHMGKLFETMSADIIDKSTQSQPWTSYVARKVLGVALATGAVGEEEVSWSLQIWDGYDGVWPLLQGCHRLRKWQEKSQGEDGVRWCS